MIGNIQFVLEIFQCGVSFPDTRPLFLDIFLILEMLIKMKSLNKFDERRKLLRKTLFCITLFINVTFAVRELRLRFFIFSSHGSNILSSLKGWCFRFSFCSFIYLHPSGGINIIFNNRSSWNITKKEYVIREMIKACRLNGVDIEYLSHVTQKILD